MDPRVGRFASIDRHPGARKKPLTLHRYLYASADPVGMRDPSGLFGMADMSAAQGMQMALSQVQANFGFALMGVAQNPKEEQFHTEMGFMILGSVAGPAAKLVGRMVAKGKRFIIGSAASGETLGKNLARAEKFDPGPGFKAHHIVAGKGGAGAARDVLEKWGIDINHPLNGVWLPDWMHAGGHSQAYYDVVNQAIVTAHNIGGHAAVIATLRQLRDDLEGGILKVSNWDIMRR